MERERRSTAGVRMSSLVGQAAQDDDEFWNHSTWVEEEDGSFHESDEESEARKDTFDSDFNDSEDDDGENDNAKGESLEEAQVLLEEKREKRASSKRKMVDVVSAGRELMQKRRNAFQRKRVLRGEGMNAGIILNMPGSINSADVPVGSLGGRKTGINTVLAQKKIPTSKVSLAASTERKSTRVRSSKFDVADVMGSTKRSAKRSLRVSTIANSIQTSQQQQQAASTATATATATARTAGGGRRAKKGKRKFTQEELILEAVRITEAENKRWLLSRKRSQMEEVSRSELNKKLGDKNENQKVICKYNSKRGCYNTLTFPSMDHLPEIFARPRVDETQRLATLEQRKKDNICVITGKKARYRDPKTGKGYHDLAAFKELRRRLTAGEKLETCPVLSDEANNENVGGKSVPNDDKAIKEGQLQASSSSKKGKEVLTQTKEEKHRDLDSHNIKSSNKNVSTPPILTKNEMKQEQSNASTQSSAHIANPSYATIKSENKQTKSSLTMSSEQNPSSKMTIETPKSKESTISNAGKKSSAATHTTEQQKSNLTTSLLLSKIVTAKDLLKSQQESKQVKNDKVAPTQQKARNPKPSPNEQLATPTKSNVSKQQQSATNSSKSLTSGIEKASGQTKASSMNSSSSDCGSKLSKTSNVPAAKVPKMDPVPLNNVVRSSTSPQPTLPNTVTYTQDKMPRTQQPSYPLPMSNNLHLNPGMQQFIPPQFNPMTQQYPLGNPTMYNNPMNQMTGHSSYYSASPFELASLYAMSLGQQQQNLPIQSALFCNNSYQHQQQNNQQTTVNSQHSSLSSNSNNQQKPDKSNENDSTGKAEQKREETR